jgi:ATP-dependent Lhr-like helicase
VPGGFAGVYPVLAALEERGAARRGYFVEGLGAAQFAVPGAVDRLRALAETSRRPADEDGSLAADGLSPEAGGPAADGPSPAGGWGGSGAAGAPNSPRGGGRTRPVRRATPGTTGTALVLAATDPANPFGAALPWPERVVDDSSAAGSTASGHRAGRKAGALVVIVDGNLVLYVERGGKTLLSYADDPFVLGHAAKGLADAVHVGALGALSVERADGASVHDSPLRDALAAAGFRVTPRGLRLRG